MNVDEALQEYWVLRFQLREKVISGAEFRKMVSGLKFRDDRGVWRKIREEDGAVLCWDGTLWIAESAPDSPLQVPEPSAPEPSLSEPAHRPAPGIRERNTGSGVMVIGTVFIFSGLLYLIRDLGDAARAMYLPTGLLVSGIVIISLVILSVIYLAFSGRG